LLFRFPPSAKWRMRVEDVAAVEVTVVVEVVVD
jgi:hypothetical protein